jgi:glutamine amidotransferase
MCRLLGMMCNDEDLLTCAIAEVAEVLKIPASSRPAGTGVAYYQNEEPLLRKRPVPKDSGVEYSQWVENLTSNVLLAHALPAGQQPWKDAQAQPFRFRKWVFGMCGELGGLAEQRETALRRLPEFLARNVQGETEAELMFHLLLNRMFASGTLNDLGVAPETVSRQIVECLDDIHGLTRAAPERFAMIVTNGQIMAAACRKLPMHYSHREGIQACSLHEDSEQQRRLHRRFKGIMLGANLIDPGHEWREVADGSLLTVSHELELRVAQL